MEGRKRTRRTTYRNRNETSSTENLLNAFVELEKVSRNKLDLKGRNTLYNQICLGLMILKGKSTYENEGKKFYAHLEQLFHLDKIIHALAHLYLGECNKNGIGVEQNLDQAAEHYSQAASLAFPSFAQKPFLLRCKTFFDSPPPSEITSTGKMALLKLKDLANVEKNEKALSSLAEFCKAGIIKPREDTAEFLAAYLSSKEKGTEMQDIVRDQDTPSYLNHTN